MFHVWTVILVYVCSRWPLEMHLVHYDRQFKFSEAAKRKRGLAVLAVFFYVSTEHNVYSQMHLIDNLILEYTCHLHTNITYIHTSPTYTHHLHTHITYTHTHYQNTHFPYIHTHIPYIHTSPTHTPPKHTHHLHTHITYMHMISGFRHKVDENFALPEYYASSGGTLINYQHLLCTTRRVQFLSPTHLTGVSGTPNMLSHFSCNYRSPINSCRTQSELHYFSSTAYTFPILPLHTAL